MIIGLCPLQCESKPSPDLVWADLDQSGLGRFSVLHWTFPARIELISLHDSLISAGDECTTPLVFLCDNDEVCGTFGAVLLVAISFCRKIEKGDHAKSSRGRKRKTKWNTENALCMHWLFCLHL